MLKKTLLVVITGCFLMQSGYALTLTRPVVTDTSSNTTATIQTPNSNSSIDLTKLDPSTKTLDPSFVITSIMRLAKEIEVLKKENANLKKENESLKSNQSKNKETTDRLEKEMAWAKLAIVWIDKTITSNKKAFDNHVHKLIGKAWVMTQNEEAWWVSYVVNPPLAKKWDGSTPDDILKRKKTLRRIQYTEAPVSKEDFEKDIASVQ